MASYNEIENPMRTNFVSSLNDFIKKEEEKLKDKRNAFIRLSEEEKRQRLIKVVGRPIDGNYSKEIALIDESVISDDGNVVATKMTFDILGIEFSGVKYEAKGDDTSSKAFIMGIHGGDGIPELIGGLVRGGNTYNYNNMITGIVKKGAVVFCPQLLLWKIQDFGSPYDRIDMNNRLLQQGSSITAIEVFLMMRTIDYFSSLPEIDEERIGSVGLSYGGMYSVFLAALDTRIKSAVSSCWFNDRAKYHWRNFCYFGAEEDCFDAEIASMILPRKLYIEAGSDDTCFTPEGAIAEYERLKDFADKNGFSDKLQFRVFKGVHEFCNDGKYINSLLLDLKVFK